MSNAKGFTHRAPNGRIRRPDSSLFKSEHPMFPQQPTNFAAMNPNPVLVPPQFGYPPFAPDGIPPFCSKQYEIASPYSVSETRSEQGSLLGFPPALAGGTNFAEIYPQPWNMGYTATPAGQGMTDGLKTGSESQERAPFVQGEYGRRSMERLQGGDSGHPKDGKGILAPQPTPPPLPPTQSSQVKRTGFYSSKPSHD